MALTRWPPVSEQQHGTDTDGQRFSAMLFLLSVPICFVSNRVFDIVHRFRVGVVHCSLSTKPGKKVWKQEIK
jgi:hypothetical protein